MLATALKPTDGGLLWLAFVAAVVFSGFKNKDQANNKKPVLIPLLLASFVIAGSIFAWAKYVNWYNDQNGNHQNLIGIYPIWDMNYDMIRYTKERILHEWSLVYQQKLILAFLDFLLLVFIWKWKRLDAFLKWFTLWTIFGTIAYSILWFKAFTDHDYYQLPLMLPAFCLSLTILAYFDKNIFTRLPSKVKTLSYGFLILLMLIGIYHNRNIQNDRYINPDYVYINPALYEIQPYLTSIGIKPNDAVVCVPDKSPNMSLNAIDHYGYSEEFNSDAYNINTFKSIGASYLIISDSSYLKNPLYMPFTNKKVGMYKGIYIFDIR